MDLSHLSAKITQLKHFIRSTVRPSLGKCGPPAFNRHALISKVGVASVVHD
jgi:hypothetical protein